MIFHCISLPHTQTTIEYVACAYTQKVRNFCRMMMSLGHVVYLYGAEDNDTPCTEFISCIKKSEQNPGEWKKDFFNIKWHAEAEPFKTMNENAIIEIRKRIKPRDFICLIGGNCQKPIADAFPENMSVEYGVGYEGIFAKYRVFESYAWMHHVYGLGQQKDGVDYDAVIPNYFDPADFPFSSEKDDYFLFIGRFIPRKGAHIAADVCKRLGAKLIMAGQGVKATLPDGTIVGEEITISSPYVEHIGTVDVKRRGELMSRARAVFVPTRYIGPFEGVHVEAMLCGTPVITTDWGVFAETFQHGVHGFRCRTLGEFMYAARQVRHLSPSVIRDRAVLKFSMNTVRFQYQEYFQRLMTLWRDGWYTEKYPYEYE